MMKGGPCWLFDLDETLHQAGHAVFPRISQRMNDYMVRHLSLSATQAQALRLHYWQRYGATLGGLLRHHRIDAAHFLHYCHDMDELLPLIHRDSALPTLLRRLPGRKWVFSNGPQHYVEAIVEHLGLAGQLTACFGIERLDYAPKPRAIAYWRVLRQAGIAARQCTMVEDCAANLRTAKRLGMRTVWLCDTPRRPPWVDHRITRLAQLARLAPRDQLLV